MYPDQFSPMTIPSIALILTAVCHRFFISIYEIEITFNIDRLNATLTSGRQASKRISPFGQTSTAQFMRATSRPLLPSASTRNPRTWIS